MNCTTETKARDKSFIQNTDVRNWIGRKWKHDFWLSVQQHSDEFPEFQGKCEINEKAVKEENKS
jgi:hypothetical protein